MLNLSFVCLCCWCEAKYTGSHHSVYSDMVEQQNFVPAGRFVVINVERELAQDDLVCALVFDGSGVSNFCSRQTNDSIMRMEDTQTDDIYFPPPKHVLYTPLPKRRISLASHQSKKKKKKRETKE